MSSTHTFGFGSGANVDPNNP